MINNLIRLKQNSKTKKNYFKTIFYINKLISKKSLKSLGWSTHPYGTSRYLAHDKSDLYPRSLKSWALNKLFQSTKFGFILLLLLLITSCGRKNNNFFVFSKKDTSKKINKLTLPVIRRLKASAKDKTVMLSWKKVKHKNLVGYNVYRFVHTAFIPREPINKEPITQEKFIDNIKKTKSKICYLIRAVFLIQNKTIEGPASRIYAINPNN